MWFLYVQMFGGDWFFYLFIYFFKQGIPTEKPGFDTRKILRGVGTHLLNFSKYLWGKVSDRFVGKWALRNFWSIIPFHWEHLSFKSFFRHWEGGCVLSVRLYRTVRDRPNITSTMICDFSGSTLPPRHPRPPFGKHWASTCVINGFQFFVNPPSFCDILFDSS